HWKDVQDELQLSGEQRQAIARMQQNWGKAMREGWGRPPGEREQRRLKLAQDQEVEVARLLSPDQHRRFKQIALQFLGPLAFSDPDVARALQLTVEQKKQFRALREQACLPMFGGPGHHGSPTDDAQKSSQEAILNLLTDDQKQQWAELTGKPSSGLAA